MLRRGSSSHAAEFPLILTGVLTFALVPIGVMAKWWVVAAVPVVLWIAWFLVWAGARVATVRRIQLICVGVILLDVPVLGLYLGHNHQRELGPAIPLFVATVGACLIPFGLRLIRTGLSRGDAVVFEADDSSDGQL